MIVALPIAAIAVAKWISSADRQEHLILLDQYVKEYIRGRYKDNPDMIETAHKLEDMIDAKEKELFNANNK